MEDKGPTLNCHHPKLYSDFTISQFKTLQIVSEFQVILNESSNFYYNWNYQKTYDLLLMISGAIGLINSPKLD